MRIHRLTATMMTVKLTVTMNRFIYLIISTYIVNHLNLMLSLYDFVVIACL